MCVAQLVDNYRTGRGGSSRPGGWKARRNLQCSSARGQAANYPSYLRVMGSTRKTKSQRMRLTKKDPQNSDKK